MFKTILPIKNLKKNIKKISKTIYFYFVLFSFIYLLYFWYYLSLTRISFKLIALGKLHERQSQTDERRNRERDREIERVTKSSTIRIYCTYLLCIEIPILPAFERVKRESGPF